MDFPQPVFLLHFVKIMNIEKKKSKTWWPNGSRGRKKAHDRLDSWFEKNRRDLPWRKKRTPWRALVSEFMLQQTQVSRVIERFEKFMNIFPTPASMVSAGEDAVITAWSGLGYYRRARFLFKASEKIVSDYGGITPTNIDELSTLPGVGRYTSGAIASIVDGQKVPIVDGNVSRVFMRIHGREGTVNEKENVSWTWEMASDFIESSNKPAISNEALMELGALCCKPQSVLCPSCPFINGCIAWKESSPLKIPLPKKRSSKKDLLFDSVGFIHKNCNILLFKRPSTGLWGGIWEPFTLEVDSFLSIKSLELKIKQKMKSIGINIVFESVELMGDVFHQTSHRDIQARVFKSKIKKIEHKKSNEFGFFKLQEINNLALGSIQKKMINTILFK